jgi:hypothetical protein
MQFTWISGNCCCLHGKLGMEIGRQVPRKLELWYT